MSKPIGKPAPAASEGEEEDAASDMSEDWKTDDDASEQEEGVRAPEEWEEWDVCQSLFDGHVAASLEENLKYMYLNFGFYFPDTEFLVDPEGLMKYLVSEDGPSMPCQGSSLRSGGWVSGWGCPFALAMLGTRRARVLGSHPQHQVNPTHAGRQAAVRRRPAVQVWGGPGGEAVQVPACCASESLGWGSRAV